MNLYRSILAVGAIALLGVGIVNSAEPCDSVPCVIEEDVIISGPIESTEDLRVRRELLKWLDNYASAFESRDLDEIAKFFNDDTMFVTSQDVLTKEKDSEERGNSIVRKIRYKDFSTDKYLQNLKRIFTRKGDIKMTVDNVSITRHFSNPHFYGLTFRQSMKTDSYMDNGWVFTLWDFMDAENPRLQVRTWQTEESVGTDGLFSIEDFFVPN